MGIRVIKCIEKKKGSTSLKTQDFVVNKLCNVKYDS